MINIYHTTFLPGDKILSHPLRTPDTMRLHVTHHGKKTTISVDDILMDYLGAWLVEEDETLHPNAKKQLQKATSFLQRYVTRYTDSLPEKNLSQHVQGRVIQLIAAPHLANILKARGPRYVKPKFDISTLFKDKDEQLALEKKMGLR